MKASFTTILVPVDFSINTEVAIIKAVELCEGPPASIHLLHVAELAPSNTFDFCHYFLNYPLSDPGKRMADIHAKLEYWQQFIRKLKADVTVYSWIMHDHSIERAIIDKGKQIAADLVIIGKNSRHSVFPFLNTVVPSRIASKSGTAVLTVKPGALPYLVRMVVVPICTRFAGEKLEIISALRKKFSIHVRLLIIVEKPADKELLQTTLLKILLTLKSRSVDNVSYEVLSNGHKGWNILNYCRKVEADMLIVQPESETRIGWFNKHISDELPARSRTQVLAVGHS